MSKSLFLRWVFLTTIIILVLVGCDVPRPASQNNGDIAEFVPPVAPSGQDAVVHLQPPSQQAALGATTTVEIRINNVNNLYGAEVQIGFDPNLLQVWDADFNQVGIQIQPGNFLSSDYILENEADNVTGDIFFTLTQLAPAPAANGSGVLATITFQSVTQGLTQILFKDLLLSDVNGQSISASAQGSQIEIISSGGVIPATATFPADSAATATPTFTSVPAAPLPASTGEATQVPRLAQDTATPTPTSSPTATFTPTPITPTAIPPITYIPPGATVGFCYRVLLGENIREVAQKFSVSAENINLANDLYPPYRILAHQALFIPTQMGHGPNVYVVQPGDSIESIAQTCKLPPTMILKANGLETGAVVQPEHALLIPIPPFPPPARFGYPTGLIPLAKPPCCQPQPIPYR